MTLLRDSLRWRLIFAAVLWIALGTGLAGVVLSAVFLHHLDAQVRDELTVHLDELEGLTTIDSDGRPSLTRPLSDPRYDQRQSGFYWEITKGNDIISRSPSLGVATIQLLPDRQEDGKMHFHEFVGPTGPLLLAEKVYWRQEGPLRFMISTDKRHIDTIMRSFNATLAWAIGGFAVSMASAAVALIVFALRPLQQLRMDLANFRSGTAARLAGTYPDEIRPLVDDLNAMIEASARSVHKARAQAGNLAHGLKTPLAILTDEAYALEQSGFDKSAQIIIGQSRRMQLQIDYQLARARAAGGRAAPGTTTLARPTVESIVSALSRLYANRRLKFEVRLDADLRVACDAQDLNEMLANLIDNACKHATQHIVIEAIANMSDGAVAIAIDDDGPGLPPQAFEVVFNIGERWDSKAQGAGLGLPIVRDLAQLYGGTVELCTSALGGLRALLILPIGNSAQP